MSGLAREAQLPIKFTIEWHAVAQQIFDPLLRLARQDFGDCGIGEASPGCNCIGSVGLRRIAFANCGGDAALRPYR